MPIGPPAPQHRSDSETPSSWYGLHVIDDSQGIQGSMDVRPGERSRPRASLRDTSHPYPVSRIPYPVSRIPSPISHIPTWQDRKWFIPHSQNGTSSSNQLGIASQRGKRGEKAEGEKSCGSSAPRRRRRPDPKGGCVESGRARRLLVGFWSESWGSFGGGGHCGGRSGHGGI
jgi:hypothetical protein